MGGGRHTNVTRDISYADEKWVHLQSPRHSRDGSLVRGCENRYNCCTLWKAILNEFYLLSIHADIAWHIPEYDGLRVLRTIRYTPVQIRS